MVRRQTIAADDSATRTFGSNASGPVSDTVSHLFFKPGHEQFLAARVVGALDAGQILNRREIEILLEVESEPLAAEALDLRQLVVVLKNTRLCNLRCAYCRSWAEGRGQVMRFETLVRTVRAILSPRGPTLIEFVWHGGEVTQLSPKYFNKLIWLQQRYARPGVMIKNLLQTNAVNLSEEWLTFLRGHRIDIGVSIDGPPKINDARRIDKDGRPTSDRIASTLRRLRASGLTFGALVVVDRALAEMDPAEFLDYLVAIDLKSANLLNVLPENDCEGGEYLTAAEFTRYQVDLHRVWSRGYRDKVALQPFLNLEAGVRSRRTAASCLWSGDCMGKFVTVEPDGEVAPCDKYVGAANAKLGDLTKQGLGEVLRSPKLKVFADDAARARDKMRGCRWFGVCQGGCPHDKFISSLRGLADDQECCGSAPLLDEIELSMQSRMPQAAS